MPPPRVSPPTPVEERKPDGVAIPKLAGRVVDVGPGAAAVDRGRCGARGSTVTLRSPRQVDDERVVPHAEPGGVVTAAADGDLELVLTGEVDGGDDVGGVAAA